RVVLAEQLLVRGGAGTVRARVAPPIDEVAAFTTLAAGVCGRFRLRRAVVDDPDFVELVNAQYDLVEFRVVGDGVGVHPVRGDAAFRHRCAATADVAEI